MKNSIIDMIDNKLSSELEEMIKEEAEKKSPDIDRLDELADMLADIHEENHDKAIEDIVERAAAQRIAARNSKIVRRISALAACAVVLFGLNQASLNAYGENVFKRVYHFTKGGVSIMIGENDSTEPTEQPTAPPATGATAPEEEVIELPTYPGDPYGIKAVCAKYGLYPMTPSYIPDRFSLTNIIEDDDSHTTNIQLTFSNNEQEIIIGYMYCKSDSGSIVIPSDIKTPYEIGINSRQFAVFKDENQYKAVCLDDKQFYTVQSTQIEYSEYEKILLSLK